MMNCVSRRFVTTKCTDFLAVLRFKLSFVAQMFPTRDLDCVLTTGTTTTSQGTHAMLLLLSAVDAPFVDSIYGLHVDATTPKKLPRMQCARAIPAT